MGRGIAVFLCERAGLDERVVLPRTARDRAVVDATPWLRPLLAVLDESWRYGVCIVDREQTWLYVFAMGELETAERARHEARSRHTDAWHHRDEPPSKAKAEERARHHYRDASERLTLLVRMGRVDLLVVGGHTETVSAFLPYLPPDVRTKVAGTFSVDPHHMTLGQVRQQTEQVVDAYERADERRLVAEAMDRVGSGGLATLGLPWSLDAVNAEAVQLLLVDDDQEVTGAVCTRCGWLGVAHRDSCPVCGGSMRDTVDVIDEAAAAVIDAGGEIEHVYAETPLRQHVVAALTRFPVPRLGLNRAAMMTSSILAAPPWHWWIAVVSLVLDVIILIALGILYYRMVVEPAHPPRHADVVASPHPRDGDRATRAGDGL